MIALEGVPTREIEFSYLGGLTLTIAPAVPDLNPLFAAAYVALIQPLTLAARLPEDHPRALTDERARPALAKAYAQAVVFGTNEPSMEDFGPEQWEDWLLEHPRELESLTSIAQVRTNFTTEAEDQAQELAREVAERLVAGGWSRG